MNRVFSISFRLRNTYKTNGIIWTLKSLPLIKKILPSSLYANSGLKVFANVISGILEFSSAFLGKAIYLLIVYLMANSIKTQPADAYTHILIFLTIIGGFLNTHIFNPTKDKYYAIFIMRMDARTYTLTDYLYFMLKMLIGFLPFSLLFMLMMGNSIISCITFPIYVVCVKLCFTALSLKSCNEEKIVNENKFTPIVIIGTLILLALAAAPPYLGYSLPEWVLWILTAVLVVPASCAVHYIIKFKEYRSIYKDLLRPENYAGPAGKSAAGAAQQLALQKKMTADVSQTSNKSGYKYFNELFMKRHSRLLTKSAKRLTICAVVFFAASVVALKLFPSSQKEVNDILMSYLPYFLFIMYLINRGRTITQAMFMNCDHSMLAYRFYRQPKAILSLFIERLKYTILINLMPAVVIALGLPLLLFVTGGTGKPINYVILFISIISMSIFFSVHSMVLYYLLQPYNVNLESKSATYGIINWVTYMICYIGIQIKMPTLGFGSAVSAFCIIYAIAAVILAYKLAPRTFKLRN